MTLAEFVSQNALDLALGGIVLVFAAVLWLGLRLAHMGRDLAEARRQAHEVLREQERAYSQLLTEAREDMLNQVGRGQQAQQKTALETAGSVLRYMERRLGEVQQHLTADAGVLRTSLVEGFEGLQKTTGETLSDGRLAQQNALNELRQAVDEGLARHRQGFEERQGAALKAQQEALSTGMAAVAKQVNEALVQHGEALSRRVQALNEATDQRLKEISGQVDKRLAEGFEKTTATFTQVLQHLTRIDEAQKKITELSSNVMTLQEILSDKRSRGAFGEVQLASLVRNILPEGSFSLQHTLGNGTRVDCLLMLPEPTGDVAVDAKFPLESYQTMTDLGLSQIERQKAARQFRQDIKKHVADIADKYILRGETAGGAMMFIPAEAVFAEIHAHHPALVEEARRRHVWLVSPTTMMAVLTTARAVLKDAATQEQVHIIQKHLYELSRDFERFQERMDKLAVHIAQAHKDVDDVHKSAKRITGRFQKIEDVELEETDKGLIGVEQREG
ncbi:MAG: DNA recombination protein RmuC [Pseudomonadota bacterium]